MTYIKICGITRIEDAEKAVSCGASALGFIAFPPSARYITSSRFAELASQIKTLKPTVELVVVMVNPSLEEVEAYRAAGADIIQFHGQETPAFVNAVKGRCWKAFNLHSADQLEQLRQYNVEKFLIDSFVKGEKIPGGSGVKADWVLSRHAVEYLQKPVILAGGITADNIVEAIEAVKPHGIDLSSGVESAPGIKSHNQLTNLFKTLGEK